MEDLRPGRPREWHTVTFAGVDLTFASQLPAPEHSNYIDAEIAWAEAVTGNDDATVPRGLFAAYNDLIVSVLDKQSTKAWERRLKDRDDPITLADLIQLTKHIVEVAAGRPTRPLSPSGSTDDSGGTRSTEGSSSQEDAEQQASLSASS